MTGRELMESHVTRFNDGVQSGDWEPMLARFAGDAQLWFENVPAGPFVGLDEIRRAYREQPPDDEIRLLGIQDDVDDGRVTAAFAWARGGTGRLVLEHERGEVTRLVVIFDQ
jgi:SnoaL-like protein